MGYIHLGHSTRTFESLTLACAPQRPQVLAGKVFIMRSTPRFVAPSLYSHFVGLAARACRQASVRAEDLDQLLQTAAEEHRAEGRRRKIGQVG